TAEDARFTAAGSFSSGNALQPVLEYAYLIPECLEGLKDSLLIKNEYKDILSSSIFCDPNATERSHL
ncbi:hypothetical protein ACJX0J_011364, partial [Zea mays]